MEEMGLQNVLDYSFQAGTVGWIQVILGGVPFRE